MKSRRYLNPPDERPVDDWGNPIGKSYYDKEWSELSLDEMAMDFEWKSDILDSLGEEVSGDTFYQDYLFRELYVGEVDGYKILLTEYDAKEKNKVNKIDVADISDFLQKNDVALSPCLFHNNWRRKDLLNYVSAFVLDIDKLRPKHLQRFFKLFDEGRLLTPSFIANSGSGVHFYYLLDKMLRIDSVNNEANNLTATAVYNCLYDDVIKKEKWKDAQRHWLGQDYRVVNSRTKLNQVSKIFKTGKVYSFDELVAYYDIQINREKHYATKKMIQYAGSIAKDLGIEPPDYTDSKATYDFISTHKDAAYLARVERRKLQEEQDGEKKKEKKKKKTVRKTGTWYKNTLFHMRDHTETGYRFSSMKALAIIAFKEKIPKEKFLDDVHDLAAYWDKFDWGGDEFNSKNVEAIERLYDSALKYYKTLPETLEEWLGYEFKRIGVKRNGRGRKEHIELMNFVRDKLNKNTDWRNKNGAPTAQEKVRQFREENPCAKPKDCIAATRLSKNTVYKWWNGEQVSKVKKKTATPRKAAELPDKAEHFDWRAHLSEAVGLPFEEILKLVKDYEDGKITMSSEEEEK